MKISTKKSLITKNILLVFVLSLVFIIYNYNLNFKYKYSSPPIINFFDSESSEVFIKEDICLLPGDTDGFYLFFLHQKLTQNENIKIQELMSSKDSNKRYWEDIEKVQMERKRYLDDLLSLKNLDLSVGITGQNKKFNFNYKDFTQSSKPMSFGSFYNLNIEEANLKPGKYTMSIAFKLKNNIEKGDLEKMSVRLNWFLGKESMSKFKVDWFFRCL